MSHKEFYDFKKLNEGAMRADAFHGIINAHHFKYLKSTVSSSSDPTVAMSNEIDGEMSMISYRRRGGRQALAPVPPAYDQPLAVNKDKIADCLSLQQYMTSKQMAVMFYSSLVSSADIV